MSKRVRRWPGLTVALALLGCGHADVVAPPARTPAATSVNGGWLWTGEFQVPAPPPICPVNGTMVLYQDSRTTLAIISRISTVCADQHPDAVRLPSILSDQQGSFVVAGDSIHLAGAGCAFAGTLTRGDTLAMAGQLTCTVSLEGQTTTLAGSWRAQWMRPVGP